MSISRSFTAVCLTISLIPSLAFAASQPSTPASETVRKELANDSASLSQDAGQAFRKIQNARLAIFDVEPDEASKNLTAAHNLLIKAQKDDAAFTKAETELHPPVGKETAVNASSDPVTWIPFDGQIMLGQDLTSLLTRPEEAKTDDAKASGDKKPSTTELNATPPKLYFSFAVAPLNETIKGVEEAQSLVEKKQFYEANAALKDIQKSVRYDSVISDLASSGARARSDAATESDKKQIQKN